MVAHIVQARESQPTGHASEASAIRTLVDTVKNEEGHIHVPLREKVDALSLHGVSQCCCTLLRAGTCTVLSQVSLTAAYQILCKQTSLLS